MSEQTKMGQSGEGNFQVDIQVSINMPLREVWDLLLSKQGLDIWLGTWKLDKWETGISFTTENGIYGKVRVFNPYSHIRLSWQRENWQNISILQIRTVTHNEKTIIHFHQEKLADRIQKEKMEKYWAKVLDELISAFKAL